MFRGADHGFLSFFPETHPVTKVPENAIIIPECVAKGSRFTFGGLGVDPCSRDPAFGVRNRSQPSARVRLRPSWAQSCRAYRKSRKNVTFLTCQKLWSCRFAWQAWHFVTLRHVSRRVQNRFVWQAQYFCYIFRRCVAFFVAGAALWTPPMSFCVAGAAFWTCRVACFLRIALSALREVVTRCKFRGGRGIL